MRVLTVVGARPQVIKAAPVSKALAANGVEEILVHTGQHYDFSMSDIFFEQLDIREPNLNLGINGGDAVDQVSRMLTALSDACRKEEPNLVLVYGDTNSTIAASLAARMNGIKLAHVEAGLRSWNRAMPEELNRTVSDVIADLLLPPCAQAVEQLIKEGHPVERVKLVGDVMYDVYRQMQPQFAGKSDDFIEINNLEPGNFGVVTMHRAENVDDGELLELIIGQLNNLADKIDLVFAVHPRTKDRLMKFGLQDRISKKIIQADPMGYLELQGLMSRAGIAVTDSGGLQKEAYFAEVPCITVRTETEWRELVDVGWNRLAHPNLGSFDLVDAYEKLEARGGNPSLYGDGDASDKIVQYVKELLG